MQKRRTATAINAGSMADIAFLLLIFFLVTTTIVEDTGILVRLPVWDDTPINVPYNKDKVLTVKVNAQNQLLVEDNPMEVSALKTFTENFILDRQAKGEGPEAVISLQNDRATNYEMYIHVYNELVAAYNHLREQYAQDHFGRSFENLSQEQRKMVRTTIPMVISEAEATSFGEE